MTRPLVLSEDYPFGEEGETGLVTNVEIVRVCGQRDAALSRMAEAVDAFKRAAALAAQAAGHAEQAAQGCRFTLADRTKGEAYQNLFHEFDGDASLRAYRHHVDASVWTYVLDATGLSNLMDATAKEEFYAQLASDNVPEVNEGNIAATVEKFRTDAPLIFQRGLARSFTALDPRFKSHDAFRFEDRIIFTHVFDQWGHLSWSNKGFDHIAEPRGEGEPGPGRPASAEVGRSEAHEAFREWAQARSRYDRLQFTSLPPESFASSGTRVQTVILQLDRPRR